MTNARRLAAQPLSPCPGHRKPEGQVLRALHALLQARATRPSSSASHGPLAHSKAAWPWGENSTEEPPRRLCPHVNKWDEGLCQVPSCLHILTPLLKGISGNETTLQVMAGPAEHQCHSDSDRYSLWSNIILLKLSFGIFSQIRNPS